MAEIGEYKFAIDVFTPLTLSMKRLHEYLANLIDLVGNENNVHFLRVDEGSAAPTFYVDRPAVVKVERRLLAIAGSSASGRAMAAYGALNEKLAEDNAIAELTGRSGSLLHFPGRERESATEIGPIIEPVILEGEVVQIGGRDESISVYLKDGDNIHICTTTRGEGRKIAAEYLFTKVRVHAVGTWKRTKDSVWKLTRSDIVSVASLKTEKLSSVVERLRSIRVPELDKIDDPIRFLDEISREATGE